MNEEEAEGVGNKHAESPIMHDVALSAPPFASMEFIGWPAYPTARREEAYEDERPTAPEQPAPYMCRSGAPYMISICVGGFFPRE